LRRVWETCPANGQSTPIMSKYRPWPQLKKRPNIWGAFKFMGTSSAGQAVSCRAPLASRYFRGQLIMASVLPPRPGTSHCGSGQGCDSGQFFLSCGIVRVAHRLSPARADAGKIIGIWARTRQGAVRQRQPDIVGGMAVIGHRVPTTAIEDDRRVSKAIIRAFAAVRAAAIGVQAVEPAIPT
jgi:hypothetical protein